METINAAESEYESDAGASPSCSESDTSSVSSRSSSPGALKIICESLSTPKKKTASASNEQARKSRRKSGQQSQSNPKPSTSSNVTATTPTKSTKAPSVSTGSVRKRKPRSERKRPRQVSLSSSGIGNKKRKMNQRRRTKSERNSRAGKLKEVSVVVEGVALDAEIDKILDEKAMKNNLTATNVKSILRHVITNNMVQKMVMSTISTGKKKVGNPDDSSDGECYFEPKLTRARTKLLLGNKVAPPWPLASPAKQMPQVSETHVLIHDELPEDSSGDEEYVPRNEDETHSEDESSSVASLASDTGSPHVSTPGSNYSSGRRQRNLSSTSDLLSPRPESLFKAPPPIKPKCVRRIEQSTIGQRTRSKLPLTDTPLEDLEMQLIPPDITTDMYDWNLSDNEDYKAFVKEFLRPGQHTFGNNEAGDDEEADPEYNIMEEEEEHDKEELRMDRAVKVSKKELNELVAELLEESHFTSGDELDETDFTSFCASQLSHMSMSNVQDVGADSVNIAQDNNAITHMVEDVLDAIKISTNKQESTRPHETEITDTISASNLSASASSSVEPSNVDSGADLESKTTSNNFSESPSTRPVVESAKQPIIVLVQPQTQALPLPLPEDRTEVIVPQEVRLFSDESRLIIQHQLRQHVQLLAQSYVTTATSEDSDLKDISFDTKRMIIEIRNHHVLNGADSILSKVPNSEAAWQLVNSWPVKSCSRSPIKKKILVEQYIQDCQTEWTEATSRRLGTYFPRHIAKIIAESDAFIYPNLLPHYYPLCSDIKQKFFDSEDILLIYGIEQLKDLDLNFNEKAKTISQYILKARSPSVIYQRIRNLRKSSAVNTTVKDYFHKGIIPIGATLPPVWNPADAVAPMYHPREKLPVRWWSIISKLIIEPKKGRPLTSPPGQPLDANSSQSHSAKRKVRVRKSRSSKSPTKRSAFKEPCVTSTFPTGMGMVQQQIADNPDLTAFPLRNVQGTPEAYMFVPNYALPAPGYNQSPRGTEAKETRHYHYCHPIPTYDRNTEITPTGKEREDPVVNFTPVGDPFNLPPDMDGEVISLSSLDTPLKRAIMEHVGQDEIESTVTVSTPSDAVTITKFADPEAERIKHSARTFGNYSREGKIRHESGTESDSSCDLNDSLEANVDDEHIQVANSISSSSSSSSSSSDDDGSSSDEDAVLSAVDVDYSGVNAPQITITLEDSDSAENIDDRNEKPVDGQESSQDNGDNNQDKELICSTSTNSSSKAPPSEAEHRSALQSSSNGGGNDGEDEDKPSRKSKLPEDADDDIEKEEDTEEDVEIPAPKTTTKTTPPLKPRSRGPSKTPRNHKRGAAVTSPKKRTSKCVPVEQMLEVDKERDDEVCDAFTQAFLTKVQMLTEPRYPGLYNEFVKLLADAGETAESQEELLAKVQSLLKDFPDLVAEYSALAQGEDSIPGDYAEYTDYEEMQAQLNFLRHLEKFTERSPQLKAKILHKFKVLKEEPNLTERDVADGLAPFFQGNPVMMEAFQAMYPSIYRPGPISDSKDFEELDMESDACNQEDPNIEIVKLPEEKGIPATNTCPCKCHETTTHVYSSRVKHCHQCCIKFQDGKVFVHNGRVVRPVTVELTSPSAARKILNGNSCGNCIQESSPKIKEIPTAFKTSNEEPEFKKARQELETDAPNLKLQTVEILPISDVEEGEILDDHDEKCLGASDKSSVSSNTGATCDSENTTMVILKPWSLDEDSLLLSTCQAEASTEVAFSKLDKLLPLRDRTEIESRCVKLISILKQNMADGEMPSEANNP